MVFKKGLIPWNKGTKGICKSNFSSFKKGHIRSSETIKKCLEAVTGKNNYQWKEKPSYNSIHTWVRRWKDKPSICEMCGVTTAKKYEWANIDHKYRRVLEDYIRVCTSCHRKYDIKNNKL